MRLFNRLLTAAFFTTTITSMSYANTVDYSVEGTEYEGYIADAGDGAPMVLLIHDWDGLTDYEIKRAEMLKEMGYSVFALDLFGKGVRPETTDEKKALTGSLYKDRDAMRQRMNSALMAAKDNGLNVDNAVTIGYCFGGAAALELARSGQAMKGYVTFHGGLATPDGQNYSQTKSPLLVLHGTADESITMDDFASLAKELEQAGVSHEMATFSGAPHAFTVFGSDRYREDADKKSWRLFSEFLAEVTQ